MTRIGLMMIVKNEAHVIERCLASVKPFIDWWVVADTGSTDGTQGLVRTALADLPGEVVERPWVNFGHNRQEVLELARDSTHAGAGDYVLWIDADEQLQGVTGQRLELDRDAYDLSVEYAGTKYSRLALLRLDRPWRWVGPVHEYLDLPDATRDDLAAPTVLVSHDGARAQDPETYRKDAALIEQALVEDPGNARLQFYLGQSWRDAGEPQRALDAYRVRSENSNGWEQERWFALYRIGQMLERLEAPPAEISEAYLTAYHACTWRAEPLVELARYERGRDRFAVALLYARRAARIPMPGIEGLFVEVDAYLWRAWDEVAVSSYWSGLYADGVMAASKALKARPDDARLKANLAWCQDKLTEG